MDLFMFLVGFFGIIVGIVMLVINAIRKAPKKKPMAILGLGIILSTVGLFMPAGADETDLKTQEQQEETDIEKVEKTEKVDSQEGVEETEEEAVKLDEEYDFQTEAEENAKQFPADSVASFEGERFKGMKYYYNGTIIDIIEIENTVGNPQSWLVENDRGYLMPVQFDYFEANIGDKVEVWGTLSGNVYTLESIGHEGVIDRVGSMHAMMVTVNDEMQY